jgi:hypothetical protein
MERRKIEKIKAIGGSRQRKSSKAKMKDLIETNQTLFTELRKLDPLLRYCALNVAKTGVFHS